MATIDEWVAADMALLDCVRPGWVDAIDLVRLNLRSCSNCILGQLYSHYCRAPEALVTAVQAFGGQAGPAWLEEWELLNQAWKQAIRRRRAGQGDI